MFIEYLNWYLNLFCLFLTNYCERVSSPFRDSQPYKLERLFQDFPRFLVINNTRSISNLDKQYEL